MNFYNYISKHLTFYSVYYVQIFMLLSLFNGEIITWTRSIVDPRYKKMGAPNFLYERTYLSVSWVHDRWMHVECGTKREKLAISTLLPSHKQLHHSPISHLSLSLHFCLFLSLSRVPLLLCPLHISLTLNKCKINKPNKQQINKFQEFKEWKLQPTKLQIKKFQGFTIILLAYIVQPLSKDLKC